MMSGGIKTLRGFLDFCENSDNGLHLTGWAQDSAFPECPILLDIVLDGITVAMVLAEVHRPDLAAEGVGRGYHSFDIVLKINLRQDMTHVVELRRAADCSLIGISQIRAA